MNTPELVGAIAAAVAVVAGGGYALYRSQQRRLPPPPPAPELAPPKAPEVALPTGPARTTVEALDVRQPVPKPTEAPGQVAHLAERAALRSGLAATRGGFIAKLGRLFVGKPQIDATMLGQIEEVLFTADIGVKTSQRLIERLREALGRAEIRDPAAVWTFIRRESEQLLALDVPALDYKGHRPFVVLTIGVNGVGKTTTLGKLGAKLQQQGLKVMYAAGDTFRAAATEQLEIWGQRIGASVVKGKEGADPSSVIFEAIKRAQAEGVDVLLCDTAGRLHTKSNLMDELDKVKRVAAKAMPGAPHETLLVLDSTNGQNAIQQAQMFKARMDVTGIVLTKLDGTAKGGVILGISDELGLPVRYIGIGERVEDMREFDPRAFVDALYEESEAAA